MRSVGKIRSFKISTRFILCTLLFLIIYFPVSIFIINAYFGLRPEHQQWVGGYKALQKELDDTRKDLRVTSQRLTNLSSFIEDMGSSDNHQAPADDGRESVEMKKVSPVAELTPDEGNRGEEKTEKNGVGVEQVVIRRLDSDKIRVSFRLVNAKPGEEAVGGYVHIMLLNDHRNIPADWTHPREEQRDGFPFNYKRGLPFYIERFKPYRHDFTLTPGQSDPTMARVLVYNQTGSITLDRQFDITNDS